MSMICFLTFTCQVLTCSDNWVGPANPTSFGIADLHFDGTNFWAVGDHGAIYKSPDGLSWERKMTNCFVPLYGIASNGNHLVAVGSNGAILESLDAGEHWFPVISGTGEKLNGVFFGNNRFLAFGNNGTLLARYSSWLDITSNTSQHLNDGLINNGRCIIVGNAGAVITSDDDLLWNFRPTGASNGFQTVCAQGNFVVAAGINNTIFRSINNGINWNLISEGGLNPPSFRASAYIGSEFHLFADETLRTSSDTVNWNGQPTSIDRPSAVFQGNAIWIASNLSGQFFVHLGAGIWQETGDFHRDRLLGIHQVGSQLLAFGTGEGLSISNDGEVWTDQILPSSDFYVDAASLNGETALLGIGGIIYSNNLMSWNESTLPATDFFRGITAGNGKWVAIGYNGLTLNTNNPANWQESTTPMAMDKLQCVSYYSGNQSFIAGGENGILFYSLDGGITWQESPDSGNLTTTTVLDFHEYQGALYALSFDGKILESTNGQNWSEAMQTFSGSVFGPQKLVDYQGDLIILGQRKVAVLVKTGPIIRDSTMRMMTVRNLSDWRIQSAIGHANPQADIIVFQDKIFTVGGNGSIHSFQSWSTDFPSWPSLSITDLLQTMHNCWQ